MQIIVLGMRWTGSSAVARLLNLMGAYFGPEGQMIGTASDNPKGRWERLDILEMNEWVLQASGAEWHRIARFEIPNIPAHVAEEFGSRAKKILLEIDIHRPWVIKDPRLCLLFPLWKGLLETPICIHVHRSPIQIAQSLRTHHKLPLPVGIALWEKYTLRALEASAGLPGIVVSYKALIEKPVETVSQLYEELTSLEVQGLRLPGEKEIAPFIDPKLFRERGNRKLQNEFVNQSQAKLTRVLEQKGELKTDALLPFSQGSQEILLNYEKQLEELQALQSQIQHQHAEKDDVNRTLMQQTEAAQAKENEYNRSRQALEKKLLERDKDLAELNQSLAKQADQYQVQERKYQQKLQALAEKAQAQIQAFEEQTQKQADELEAKTRQIRALQQKIQCQKNELRKLTFFAEKFSAAIPTIFNSLTWRMGYFIADLGRKVTFRPKKPLIQDHLQKLRSCYLSQNPDAITAIKQGEFISAKRHGESFGYKEIAVGLRTYRPNIVPGQGKLRSFRAAFRRKANREIERWSLQPLISIIVPVYNVDKRWLDKAIQSVENQIYPHWELCIADDNSTNEGTINYLKSLQDKRIKIKFLKKNQGISGASNEALSLAQGEYIALLDHNDELAEDALYEVAKAINEYQPDLIYSDEDKITLEDELVEPHFKSDYSPDMILSQNYISNLGVYRKSIVDETRGFRKDFDGSQDYDLLLRFLEQSEKVYHIPKVLYHCRKIPDSTADTYHSKSYAWEAGRKALQEAMQRRSIKAQVEYGPDPGTYRIKREILNQPLVSIIIPFKDKPELLRQCLDSILDKSSYNNFEIIGVSNYSTEPEKKN